MLSGRRIKIRRVCKSDIPLLVKWFKDQEIYSMTTTSYYFQSPQNIEKGILSAGNLRTLCFVVSTFDNKVISFVRLYNISWISRNANFEIMIGEREYRNKNYWAEIYAVFFDYVFNCLNLRKISGFISENNKRSLKLVDFLRANREAILKKHFYYNGRYYDRHIFSIFRDEYKQRLEKLGRRYLLPKGS